MYFSHRSRGSSTWPSASITAYVRVMGVVLLPMRRRGREGSGWNRQLSGRRLLSRAGRAALCEAPLVWGRASANTKAFGKGIRPSPTRGHRHHVAAFPARPRLLVPVEGSVGAGHGIGAIVVHDEALLVQERVAPRAEPLEAIHLAGPPLPLDDEGVGVAGKARGVRRAGGRVDDRALLDHGDLLRALGRPVVEAHRAGDLVHELVARVDVELAAVVAAARHERERLLLLPEDLHLLAALSEGAGGGPQIDDRHRQWDHGGSTSGSIGHR